MTTVVMAVNSWPESEQQDFKVFNVRDGESEESAIQRAKNEYSDKDEFYIVNLDH